MKSNKENQVRLVEEILNNRLVAKKLVKQERDKKKRKLEKVKRFFKQENVSKIFESDSTILKEQRTCSLKVDFVYYKLNVEYLKSQQLEFTHLKSKIIESESGKKIAYIEYYLNEKESYMILVKYNFKNIRLCSENNSTNFSTYVFINTSDEIYYYDEFLQNQLLNRYDTGMGINCAKDILLSKQFKISPLNDARTYQLITPESSREVPFKDIHLIIKQLLDILLEQYKDNVVPSESELKIESHLLGTTQECVSVQSKVIIDYRNSGIVECHEKLFGYEIILYFSDVLDKKVTAKLYLTENEMNEFFTITNEYLKYAILEDNDEELKKDWIYNNSINLFMQVIVPKMKQTKQYMKELIRQNISIEEYSCEHPILKDTFKKIYMKFFRFDTQSENHFKKLSEDTIKYNGSILEQNSIYYTIYQNEVYLIKICSKYESYEYKDNSFMICIPSFGISEILAEIFKPVTPSEVNRFINGNEIKGCLGRKISAYIDKKSCYYNLGSRERNFEYIFPNFSITNISERMNDEYEITNIYSEEIYRNILNCIQNFNTGLFKCFKDLSPWGYDEEIQIKRIPISSNNVTYGYYYADVDENKRKIKFVLKDDNGNKILSKGEDLLEIEFEKDSYFYRTTFYHLIEKQTLYTIKNNGNILKINDITEYEMLKICIDFLLENQDKIFLE